MKLGRLNIQYHRMPKYLGKYKTTAPSYIRVFLDRRFLLDISCPKYGRE